MKCQKEGKEPMEETEKEQCPCKVRGDLDLVGNIFMSFGKLASTITSRVGCQSKRWVHFVF